MNTLRPSNDNFDKPNVFRQQSGIEISEENIDKVRFVRCILRNKEGKINTNIINELFDGLFKWGETYIEYYGHPSTMIIDNTSVVITSQIFEREYSLNQSKYESVNTYEDYFQTKKTHSNKITWLGSPSIIYSYKNRLTLKKFLNENLVINLFFWITSFNSSTCIRDFTRETSGISYCDKYAELKKYCADTLKYRIHKTYFEWINNFTLNESKFITDFESAVERIHLEDEALKVFNNTIINNKKYYQRYNEVFTLFFPWDVEGIEIGTIPKGELTAFVDEYITKRTVMIRDFESILSDDNKITTMNNLTQIILLNDGNEIQKYLNNENLSYTFFLLTKYILLSNCDIVELINTNYKINVDHLSSINQLISVIISILSQPLKFFEYKLNDDDFTFQLVEVELNNDRHSEFVLFEQEKNETTNITHVYKSNKKLTINYGGSRKIFKKKLQNNRKKTKTLKKSVRK
jgi:hypothetical protein